MIGASILKEVWLLMRDRGRLISLFALPVVFMVVFGSMFKFGPDKGQPRPIGIWHEANDARAAAIETQLDATPGFVAKAFPSPEALRHAVAHDDLAAGLIVPADFDPTHGKLIELSIDEGAPIQVRGPIEGAVIGAVTRALSPVAPRDLPPLVIPKTPPGVAHPLADVSAFQVTVPGNAVLFAFFISMAVAITFAHERHTGVWKRLLAAPVPRWEALVGKLVPYFLIAMVQLAFLFGLGAGVFGMKIAGSVAALALVSAALSLCAVTFGLLVSSFGGTERQIGSTVPVVILVMGLLGGCMFPRMFMPAFMKQIGTAVPQSWALDGYYAVLVRQGTGVAEIAPQLIALTAFALGFALLGLWRFKFER
ncbi:MAG: ABC transporter permease [Kofleriaceae bacterium]